MCRGPVLVIGDSNSHHRRWCTKQTPGGTSLDDWCKEGWSISISDGPTFTGRRGATSTIYLVIHRSCGNLITTLPVGSWESSSDHRLIITTVQLRNGRPLLQVRKKISKRARSDDIICGEAVDFLKVR